jgi:hypothetical protein
MTVQPAIRANPSLTTALQEQLTSPIEPTTALCCTQSASAGHRRAVTARVVYML